MFKFFFVAFPDNCTTVSPPLTLECVQALWNQSNCDRAGAQYPADAAFLSTASYANGDMM